MVKVPFKVTKLSVVPVRHSTDPYLRIPVRRKNVYLYYYRTEALTVTILYKISGNLTKFSIKDHLCRTFRYKFLPQKIEKENKRKLYYSWLVEVYELAVKAYQTFDMV